LVSSLAALFTYRNLREIRKQFFESNRGNLVFYISNDRNTVFKSLIIKNFGYSSAKLLDLQITPDLDWNKTRSGISNKFVFSNCKNIFFAPKQFISGHFDFREYPDRKFDIVLKYETCGKVIESKYSIDLSYTSNLIESSTNISNELTALKEINKSIRQFSDSFI
ncbi:MAG: hypothetical protein RSB84_07365, partial [Erysipelotrichaceae bacterium]